jgi:hypothetical protein
MAVGRLCRSTKYCFKEVLENKGKTAPGRDQFRRPTRLLRLLAGARPDIFLSKPPGIPQGIGLGLSRGQEIGHQIGSQLIGVSIQIKWPVG